MLPGRELPPVPVFDPDRDLNEHLLSLEKQREIQSGWKEGKENPTIPTETREVPVSGRNLQKLPNCIARIEHVPSQGQLTNTKSPAVI